jgi:hypothetical protein
MQGSAPKTPNNSLEGFAMKMKKRITVLLAALMILSVLIPAVPVLTLPVQAAGVGELIEFGGREWRVLDRDGDYALVLYDTVITNQPFHHTSEAVTWETSSSRFWLNGYFFNSFSAEDRSRIRETYVINNDNPWWGTSGGANTTDRVFLLSIDEVLRYFGDSGMVARGSDPAVRDDAIGWLEQGIGRIHIHDQYSDARASVCGFPWWLRSPGSDPLFSPVVAFNGAIALGGTQVNWHDQGGLRPALWLRLDDGDNGNGDNGNGDDVNGGNNGNGNGNIPIIEEHIHFHVVINHLIDVFVLNRAPAPLVDPINRLYINATLVFADGRPVVDNNTLLAFQDNYHSYRIEYADGRIIEYIGGNIIITPADSENGLPMLVFILLGIIVLLLIIIIIILLAKRKKKDKEDKDKRQNQ